MLPPMWPRPTKPILVVCVFMSGTPFDDGEVVAAQLEVGGADDRIDLVGPSEADDRAVDGRVTQGPGDGDGAKARVVALCNGTHALDDREALGEARLLEARIVLAPVVLGQAGEPFARHRACQQARAHR